MVTGDARLSRDAPSSGAQSPCRLSGVPTRVTEGLGLYRELADDA